MSKQFPNYAKSEHPAVIEAVRAIYASKQEFMDKARELSLKYTDGPGNVYYSGWFLDSLAVTGLSANSVDVSALPGKWKKPVRNVIAPYVSNPVTADFKIRHKAVDIPGRGNLVWGHGRLGTGIAFEHVGAVYSYFGFDRHPMSVDGQTEADRYGWTEILASEYHKAKEDYISENE